MLLFTKKKFTYKSQIIASFAVSVASMIALPVTVILLSGRISFYMTCFVILLQGLSNAISLSCLYSLISFLPFQYIIAFSTGQGIAGILMNALRYLIVISLGDPDNKTNIIEGSIIFFSIAALIISICIVFVFLVYKNPFFMYKMINSGEFPDKIFDILEKNKYSILNDKVVKYYDLKS
jgi:hypothetical protein